MSWPKTNHNAGETILNAGWVYPMSAPPIRDGAVVIAGDRILDLGPSLEISKRYPGAQTVDLTNCTLLPGLVNAHTHLELSLVPRPPAVAPGGFVGWLEQIIAAQTDPVAAVYDGGEQCLRFGVTTVGDISRQPDIVRPILRDSPLRVVSFGEVSAMAKRRALLDDRLGKAADSRFQSPRLQTGISPHAPYSIEADGYRLSLQTAQQNKFPLTTHLAETPFEAAFLSHHTGPFRDLWNSLDGWDDQVQGYNGGPIRFAQSLGLLNYPTLLAHVNYCDNEELKILARGRASVVWCPRTHDYFGHPPHRWQAMHARGINIAVGTDSCASSGDLNLVDDLRLIHRQSPEVPSDHLWRLVTTRAAKALGLSDGCGILAKDSFADIVAFSTTSDDPLTEILENPILPLATWAAGSRF